MGIYYMFRLKFLAPSIEIGSDLRLGSKDPLPRAADLPVIVQSKITIHGTMQVDPFRYARGSNQTL